MKTQLFSLKTAGAVFFLALGLTSCKKDEVTEVQKNTEGLTAAKSLKADGNKSSALYELVWSDTFAQGIDSTRWTVVTGNQNVHHELQSYTADAVTTSQFGGVAFRASRIKADGQDYTSGKITTAGKFAIQYGRIETRLRMPYALGLVPEFSMQGTNYAQDGLPASGEIDVMQHTNRDFFVYGGIQWDNSGHAVYRGSSSPALGPVLGPGYHTFAVEWDDQKITWYADEKVYWVANIADNINSTDEFHKPFFINLGMAVGGDLGGNIIDSALPTSMVVDYVKVYKLAGSTAKISK